MLCPLRTEFKGHCRNILHSRNLLNRKGSWRIISSMAAYAGSAPAIRREPGWIYKPSWDLPLLIFSAALVPLPFLFAWAAQVTGWLSPRQAIDASISWWRR